MFKALIAGVLALSFAAPTQAAVVSLNFKFKASNFNAGAPVNPVQGTVKLVFDNGANISPQTAGLTLTDFNLPIAASFSYRQSLDLITIGSSVGLGSFSITSGQNNFGFFLSNASTATPQITIFSYSSSSAGGFFDTRTVELTAVPEPATWALLIGGFGLAGAALRKTERRRLTA